MKTWLYRIGKLLLILLAVLLLIAAWGETDTTVQKGYKQNEQLRTIKDGWPGTPVDQKDRFMARRTSRPPRKHRRADPSRAIQAAGSLS